MSCFCTASSFAGLRFPLSSSLLAPFQIRFLALPPNHQSIFQTTGNAPQIPAPSDASVRSVPSPLTALNSTVSLAHSNPPFKIFQRIGSF
nr:MAG TPA: hypothetical protein [Caudoviricetes sp.]